jgi:hypothetical protein
MNNSSDTIGNRTRDLPVYSAVPQPLRHRMPMRNSGTGQTPQKNTACETNRRGQTPDRIRRVKLMAKVKPTTLYSCVKLMVRVKLYSV